MSYTMKYADAIGFAQFMNAETRERGQELWFRRCPRCGNTAGPDDEWKFSINLDSGAFKCFRGSCGYSGHFVEICREYNYPLVSEEETAQIYKRLHVPANLNEPKDSVIEYFKTRGISAETVAKYQISHKQGHPEILLFPFFNITGNLECVKYRHTKFVKEQAGKNGMPESKEWIEKDTKPILFGMNRCEGFDRVVITEGQIDSLSLSEAGIPNAVSVPMGCKNFAWWPHCYEWLTQFNEIVVFGDREKGHITLIDEILDRIGSKMTVKCVQPADYLFEKDANDILRAHGAEWLRRAVENASVPSVSAVKPLNEVSVVDLNELEKIPTGIKALDRAIGGLVLGTVTLLSGRSGEGKSTFMSQLVCSALEDDRKVFIYSGELEPHHFRRWLDLQLATDKHVVELVNASGTHYGTIHPDTADRIGKWYAGKAYIYDNGAELDKSSVISTIERAIRQYGVQLICVDNLMTAMEAVRSQDDLYRAQGEFVKRLKEIAKHYNVAVILVAHPKKNNDRAWNNDNVSGAAEIINYVDVAMSYSRNKENAAQSLLEIGKNRLTGVLQIGQQALALRYSALSKRIYDQSDTAFHDYGWTKAQEAFETVPADDLPF